MRRGTALAVIIILILAPLIAFAYLYEVKWTGFVQDEFPKSETIEYHQYKTLWDWLQVVGLPLSIAVLGLWVNYGLKQRDESRQLAASQADALRSYYEILSGLVTSGQPTDDSALVARRRGLLRAVTLMTLRQVDADGKSAVVQFLTETNIAGLTHSQHFVQNIIADRHTSNDLDEYTIALDGADLSYGNYRHVKFDNVSLCGVIFTGCNLDFVSLRGASIDNSDLPSKINLVHKIQNGMHRFVKLTNVDLSCCDLSRCVFSSLDLSGANLSNSILYGASFENSNLSGANLLGASCEYVDFDSVRLDQRTRFDQRVGNILWAISDKGNIRSKLSKSNGLDLSSAILPLRWGRTGAEAENEPIVVKELNISNSKLHFAVISNIGFISLKSFFVNYHGCQLHDITFDRSDFSYSTFEGGHIANCRFNDKSLIHCTFNNIDLSNIEFGEQLDKITFNKVRFNGCNFSKMKYSDHEFTECEFDQKGFINMDMA